MKTLTLNTRKSDDIAIVELAGRLTAGDPTLLLRHTIGQFLTDGNRDFVINLGDVKHIDSTGLGELVMTFTTVSEHDGYVCLASLNRRCKDLLQIVKLTTVFDVFDSVDEALRSLECGRKPHAQALFESGLMRAAQS